MAGKFSGLNIRGREEVVPQMNTASQALESELARKGVPLPAPVEAPPEEADYSYARAAAQAPIPENRQQAASAGTQGGITPTEEQMAAQSEESQFKLYPEEAQGDFLSSSGKPRTYEEVQRINAEEQRRQAADANASNVEWQDKQQFKMAYPRAGEASNEGVIHDSALMASSAMAKMDTSVVAGSSKMPVALSGMTQLKVGLNADAKKASNISVAAIALALPIISGASRTEDNMVIDTPEAGSFSAFLQESGGEAWQVKSVGGGIELNQLYDMVGAAAIKLSNTSKVNSEGKAIDPRSVPQANISPRVAGAIIVKGWADAGVISLGKTAEGISYGSINPIRGQDFYKASQGVAGIITDAGKGKSMLTPGTATGGYAGGRRNLREGDRKKVNYVALEAAAEAKRIGSSIGMVTSPVKAFFAGIIGYASLRGQADAKKLVGIIHDDLPEVALQKNKGWAKRMEGLAGHIKDNMPRYAAYWTDYGSQRMYSDAADANPQANKDYRAVVTPINKPPIQVHTSQMHMGVPKAQGQAILRNIARKADKKDFTMTAEEQEFAFLATWAHAIDLGKKYGQKTDGVTVEHLVSLIDYQTLSDAAAIGAQLRSINTGDRDAVISSLLNPANFDPNNLTPAQLGAINKLLAVSDKETWGYRLQAYLDADKYLEAKRNKVGFTPQVTTAIDMNSAGRAFLGADIGNIEVTKRIGLLMQEQWNEAQVDKTGSTQPYGSPRDYFLQIALDSGVDTAFGTVDKDLGAKIREQLTFFSDPDKNDRAAAFSKDFGKKVLMTTDYGKPANYHIDNALLFLHAHPEFADKLLPLFKNDLGELAKAVNEVYAATLRKATSIWQQKLPKDLVRITQMMNEALAPEGYYGEPLSLGGFKYEETGDYTEVAGERIAHTKRIFDLHAAAEDKRSKAEQLERDAPGPGTRARNQIGPILGQYRESVLVMETLIYINGGKLPKDMLFALPVFDNFVLDAHSFLQFRHVANNIILPKVMAWDIQSSIKKDFEAKTKAFDEKLNKGEDSVDIGSTGEYYGVLYNLDAEYKYMKDSDPKDMSYGLRQLYELLHNPASGYIPPSATRPDSIFMTKAQIKNAVHTFARAKMFVKYSENANPVNLLDKWVKQGLIAKHDLLSRLKDTFARGRAHFMT